MVAIILDANAYLKEYSTEYRTPDSILVEAIPEEEDFEKLQCYQYIDENFVFDKKKWAAIEAERAECAAMAKASAAIESIEQNIEDLKKSIELSDYKIIKCYEYAMNDLELPYDIKKLHEERQAIRDQINALQATL